MLGWEILCYQKTYTNQINIHPSAKRPTTPLSFQGVCHSLDSLAKHYHCRLPRRLRGQWHHRACTRRRECTKTASTPPNPPPPPPSWLLRPRNWKQMRSRPGPSKAITQPFHWPKNLRDFLRAVNSLLPPETAQRWGGQWNYGSPGRPA